MTDKTTMKEVPESERPYEKCLRYGAASLSDAELLAVILRCGSAGEKVSDLALRLLIRLRDRGGLGALRHMSAEELKECRGIGSVKAVQLLCAGELAVRISREDARDRVRLNCASSIADYFMEDLRHESREQVVAAFFDTRCHLLHSVIISRGTVNSAALSPREVYLEALRYRAVYVVLLHNHPSGDPSPSREDLELTDRVVQAGQILSVPLMDHIIIGDHRYVSLKEQGYIL